MPSKAYIYPLSSINPPLQGHLQTFCLLTRPRKTANGAVWSNRWPGLCQWDEIEVVENKGRKTATRMKSTRGMVTTRIVLDMPVFFSSHSSIESNFWICLLKRYSPKPYNEACIVVCYCHLELPKGPKYQDIYVEFRMAYLVLGLWFTTKEPGARLYVTYIYFPQLHSIKCKREMDLQSHTTLLQLEVLSALCEPK